MNLPKPNRPASCGRKNGINEKPDRKEADCGRSTQLDIQY